VILLGCEGAVNQPDVPGFAPKRWRSKSEKGPSIWRFLDRGADGMAILRS
jgi:hypothetical protein